MDLDTHVQKNDPYILFPHYRELFSGNKDGDSSIYLQAYPASIYPVLHLGFPIYDNLGNKLDPGHYEVALSYDQKHLLLIQSKKIVARVLVIKCEFYDDEYEKSKEQFEHLKDKIEHYKVRRNKKKTKQFEQELEYQNAKLLAKNKVEIDISYPEYFIIDYTCNFAHAVGFIRRASQD